MAVSTWASEGQPAPPYQDGVAPHDEKRRGEVDQEVLAGVQRRKLKLNAKLKAFHHIIASSAETIRVFNTGFDTVNLHCPTGGQHVVEELQPLVGGGDIRDVAAEVEIESENLK
jgi:hypothetical protein